MPPIGAGDLQKHESTGGPARYTRTTNADPRTAQKGFTLVDFSDSLSKLGKIVQTGAETYYTTRLAIKTGGRAIKHKESGYDYSSPLLGDGSGDLPPGTRGAEEYAADSAVNAVARQTERLLSQLWGKIKTPVIATASLYAVYRIIKTVL